jgi:hypothetical protein
MPGLLSKGEIAEARAEDGDTGKGGRSLARELTATLKVKYGRALKLVNEAAAEYLHDR